MTILEAALEYQQQGLSVIPVSQDKRPYFSWDKYRDQPATQEQVNEWWKSYPQANVAIILGRGLFAVDLDDLASLAKLEGLGVVIPATAPLSATSRGVHYFLKGQAPDRVALIPGVDIRGSGYVVAPPSIHASGAFYTWIRPITTREAIPDSPASLIALLAKPSPPTNGHNGNGTNGGWVTEALAGVGEGQRDITCTRLAGYFLQKGIPVEATESILAAWGERCNPAFAQEMVVKCVASIAKREPPLAGVPTIAEAIDKVVQEIRTPVASRRPPAATRLQNLDFVLDGGFQAGELIYFGSRPGVGKTTLALQIARAVAKTGRGVFVVSREMTTPQLTRRMLVQEAQVRASAIKTGVLTDGEQKLVTFGADMLRTLPVWLTTNLQTAAEIEDALNTFAPGTLSMLVVDYLQLLHGPKGIQDRRLQVEHVSQALKTVAIKHDISVLCLSSLSRPPSDASKNWRPALANLRDSGELEHDADVVLLGYRDMDSKVCELHIAKNRDGRIGLIYLTFDEDRLTFSEGAKPK